MLNYINNIFTPASNGIPSNPILVLFTSFTFGIIGVFSLPSLYGVAMINTSIISMLFHYFNTPQLRILDIVVNHTIGACLAVLPIFTLKLYTPLIFALLAMYNFSNLQPTSSKTKHALVVHVPVVCGLLAIMLNLRSQ